MGSYAPRQVDDFSPLREMGLPRTPSEQIAAVRTGLPVATFRALAKALGISEAALAGFTGLSQTTLTRRKRGGRLYPDEGEHLLRLALLLERASAVFDSAADAADWLKSSNPSLGNSTPLDFARSEIGAREVVDLLGRIEYGVYS
ncbi:MAG: antitoxin Xre/MbcA/ParS toxin-binding domain-containing protein [Trueperaceae bacterium]